jgi:DNA-binding Lrp family transcriptional regulator
VSYVGFISGEFDVLIEVYVRDDEHLFRFLTEDLARISDIESSHVWAVLHTQKYNYAWANPFESSLLGPHDGLRGTNGRPA